MSITYTDIKPIAVALGHRGPDCARRTRHRRQRPLRCPSAVGRRLGSARAEIGAIALSDHARKVNNVSFIVHSFVIIGL